MSIVDLSFNDFECKSIEKLCPDRNFEFSEDTYDAGMVFSCTIIDVFDNDSVFVKRYISAISVPGSFQWKKVDISILVSIINEPVNKNNTIISIN